MPPVQQEFIMQVWAGGEAGRSNSADNLPLVHVRAGLNVVWDGAQVRITCPNLAGMAKLDQPAIRAHPSRSRDDPGSGSLHRRSGRGAVVYPLVCPPLLEQGMKPASREVAGDAIGHRVT